MAVRSFTKPERKFLATEVLPVYLTRTAEDIKTVNDTTGLSDDAKERVVSMLEAKYDEAEELIARLSNDGTPDDVAAVDDDNEE
jgi:hypothetical protein